MKRGRCELCKAWERNLISPRRQEELQQQRGGLGSMEKAVRQGSRVKGAGDPAGGDVGRSSAGVGDRRPASRSNGCPRSDGRNRRRACLKKAFCRLSSGSQRPDIPSSQPGSPRYHSRRQWAGGWWTPPRAFDTRPAGRWSAGGLREACSAAAWAERPRCQAPLKAPRHRSGWGEGRGGGRVRGLLSQGWPSLFDKLIA